MEDEWAGQRRPAHSSWCHCNGCNGRVSEETATRFRGPVGGATDRAWAGSLPAASPARGLTLSSLC